MTTRSRASRAARAMEILRFGSFEFDARAAELRRAGVRIRLQEQPLRILTALVEHPGEVVTREQIRQRLWPNGTIVEVSHGINAAIQRLREALGESAENPQFIETLARRGYRFIARVETGASLAPAEPSTAGDPKSNAAPPSEVSHFRVLERIGAGGMGVVYRAEDLKLGRSVALKFLPDDLAHDPAALARFRREAQAASALNHPNICTVYGIEECEGRPVIVMEYIEGESLEALLRRGPLPLTQAVLFSIRMADALDAAHRAGIVHRDLKPANVLVANSGDAAALKVLDFGLAKMDRAPALGFEPPNVTREGAILGTLHYLSPEQAQGQPAEPRSDIFSLGAVLYEMLTGRRAFDGPNPARVMAAILALDPPPLDVWVPPALASTVRRCLAKEPEARWQSARELKAALEAPKPAEAPLRTPFNPQRFRPWAIAGMAAACVAGAVIASAYFMPRYTPTSVMAAPAPARASTIAAAMPVARLALSPNGMRVAFVSDGRLYVSNTSGDSPLLLGAATGTPFWSPDSRSIAVANPNNDLMRFDAAGATPALISQVNTQFSGAWGPDGTILIGFVRDGLYRVPANGGALERVTQLASDRGDTRHIAVQFLPGGRYLYIAGSQQPGASMLYAGDLRSQQATPVMPISSFVQYASGFLVYVEENKVAARRFDWKTLKASGPAMLVADAPAGEMAANAAVKFAHFSAAGDKLALANKMGGITLIEHWTAGL